MSLGRVRFSGVGMLSVQELQSSASEPKSRLPKPEILDSALSARASKLQSDMQGSAVISSRQACWFTHVYSMSGRKSVFRERHSRPHIALLTGSCFKKDPHRIYAQ